MVPTLFAGIVIILFDAGNFDRIGFVAFCIRVAILIGFDLNAFGIRVATLSDFDSNLFCIRVATLIALELMFFLE